MTISKLTEENRGDKTIQRFLKFYDPNLKKIQKKHKGLTLQQVEKDKAKLESVKQQISRI